MALLVPLVVTQAFLVLSSWHICLAFPLEAGTAAWRAAVAHLAAAVTTSALWVGVGRVWAATLDPLRGEMPCDSMPTSGPRARSLEVCSS